MRLLGLFSRRGFVSFQPVISIAFMVYLSLLLYSGLRQVSGTILINREGINPTVESLLAIIASTNLSGCTTLMEANVEVRLRGEDSLLTNATFHGLPFYGDSSFN